MKCPDCKGSKVYVGLGLYAAEACRACGGSGVVEEAVADKPVREICDTAVSPRDLAKWLNRNSVIPAYEGQEIMLVPSGGTGATLYVAEKRHPDIGDVYMNTYGSPRWVVSGTKYAELTFYVATPRECTISNE